MGWQEEEEVPEDEPSVANPEDEDDEEEVVDKFTRVCRTCFQDDIGAPENYQWCALEGGLLFKDAKWEVGHCYNCPIGDSKPITKAILIIIDDSSVESESDDEPVEEPEPVEKFKNIMVGVVRYKYNVATMAVYIIHKDADGNDDTLKRQPLGTLQADKTIKWYDYMIQHKVARSFMEKEVFESMAKHPDDTDLDLYKMTFDCNAEVPIIGEVFYIKMGGVKYEVTDENGGGSDADHPDPQQYVVKHNGVVLPGLLFDADAEDGGITAGQLVGLTHKSKQFRSAHRDRVKKLTSPKKKRTAKTTASELAKKSAGGSAVSPA